MQCGSVSLRPPTDLSKTSTRVSEITPGKGVWRRRLTGTPSVLDRNGARFCRPQQTGQNFAIRTRRCRGGVSSVPVGDERQRRTGQQLLELVGAQDLAAQINLPDPRARPGAVQQRRLTHQQAPVLREETSPVLPITLLISNTPEFLSEIERQENEHTHE